MRVDEISQEKIYKRGKIGLGETFGGHVTNK